MIRYESESGGPHGPNTGAVDTETIGGVTWAYTSDGNGNAVIAWADIAGGLGAVVVPEEWTRQFPQFEERFGSDFAAALQKETGKTDAQGNALLVWQDYVAGTDPTNPEDRFQAIIRFVDGDPVIEWSPRLTAAEESRRTYTIYGKTSLSPDENWSVVSDGEAGNYNFFRVTVEMR